LFTPNKQVRNVIEVIDSLETQNAIKRAVSAFGKEKEDITYINISGPGRFCRKRMILFQRIRTENLFSMDLTGLLKCT